MTKRTMGIIRSDRGCVTLASHLHISDVVVKCSLQKRLEVNFLYLKDYFLILLYAIAK